MHNLSTPHHTRLSHIASLPPTALSVRTFTVCDPLLFLQCSFCSHDLQQHNISCLFAFLIEESGTLDQRCGVNVPAFSSFKRIAHKRHSIKHTSLSISNCTCSSTIEYSKTNREGTSSDYTAARSFGSSIIPVQASAIELGIGHISWTPTCRLWIAASSGN